MFAQVAADVAALTGAGTPVVLVSSGAIAMGLGSLGREQRSRRLPELQAASAIGQSLLLRRWEAALGRNGLRCAQVLLTVGDIQRRDGYLNATAMNKRLLLLSLGAIVCLGLRLTLHAQQANNEEFARRQYESGVTFIQNHRYAEGLKDLQAVVDSFAATSMADNALLQIAQYQLDIARDARATQASVDRLLKDYPDTDSAPMAHVLAGRLALIRGRSPQDVDTAMASYERVLRLFPGSDAVPAAGFYAGETLRMVRRTDEALERFRRVTMEYPRSPWAARAALSAGYCLVQQEKPAAAMQEIQWVRQQFPNTPVAAEALNLNTIIYRLVRPPAGAAHVWVQRQSRRQ